MSSLYWGVAGDKRPITSAQDEEITASNGWTTVTQTSSQPHQVGVLYNDNFTEIVAKLSSRLADVENKLKDEQIQRKSADLVLSTQIAQMCSNLGINMILLCYNYLIVIM
eukprot:Phypoly_transcript_17794.p1 GENE.Phypoly_transcript_17794~~Phypoly_transcript_17794.p1  ORF type:complete len:110 (+),score=11.99 Phypoly_transcript_17794:131-460(+)